MKAKVLVKRDEDDFPRLVEIKKGRSKLIIKQTPSPDGELYLLETKGRGEDFPDLGEIWSIVNARRLDRIGIIDLVSLIKKIEEIELIEKIGLIEEIETIRDVTYNPRTFIQNPYFDQEFTGWVTLGDPTVLYSGLPKFYMAHFTENTLQALAQNLYLPLGVDWMSAFYCYLWGYTAYLNVDILKFTYWYTDGTTSEQTLQATKAGLEKKTLTPTAGKHIFRIEVLHEDTWGKVGLTWITTVF